MRATAEQCVQLAGAGDMRTRAVDLGSSPLSAESPLSMSTAAGGRGQTGRRRRFHRGAILPRAAHWMSLRRAVVVVPVPEKRLHGCLAQNQLLLCIQALKNRTLQWDHDPHRVVASVRGDPRLRHALEHGIGMHALRWAAAEKDTSTCWLVCTSTCLRSRAPPARPFCSGRMYCGIHATRAPRAM